MPNKRVILSLTEPDLAILIQMTHNACSAIYDMSRYNNTSEYVDLREKFEAWNSRMHRIYDHMNDTVNVHFTDLGTED